MNKFELISHPLCPYVQRAVIILSEKNIPHDRTYIDLANRPAWFKALSPLGKVPVLKTAETNLFESQVIAEYLNEITPGSLHPEDPLNKARHRSWIEFGSATLNLIGGFYNAPDKEVFNQKQKELRRHFELIEKEIEGPYFAGNTFYMIDGVWGTIFRYFDVFDRIGDFDIMAKFGGVLTWRKTLAQRVSITNAAPADYTERLYSFLQNRNSYLSTLMNDNDLHT